MSALKLSLHGATGRMGLSLVRLSRQGGDIRLVGAICASNDPAAGRDVGELAGVGALGVSASADVGSGLLGAEVVIDFSTAGAVASLCANAARAGVAIVSGTTNLDEGGERALAVASQSVPVLWAPNMSLGIQVLAELVEQALKSLGTGYDVEIVETHHRRKIDAPSGTAKRLAAAAHSARAELKEIYGRQARLSERADDELALLSLRGGDVIGDHSVHLFGPGERLELTHRATSRDLFAYGALSAARFLRGKNAGRYSIADVLRSSRD